MKRIPKVIVVGVIFMLLIASLGLIKRGETVSSKKFDPGIALTFDDKTIEQWHNARELFNKYNVNVTFFVSKIHALTKKEISMLKELRDDGHEIGSHSFNHLNAERFVSLNFVEDYIDYEINPSIKLLKRKGFSPGSFAYPFGARSEKIDEALFNKFEIIRGTAYTNNQTRIKDLDKVYYSEKKENRLIFAVGIDEIYKNTNDEIIQGIERAEENKEILIFYGHSIGKTAGKDEYKVDIDTLEEIIKFTSEKGLKFYTVSDIAKLKK